MCIHLDTISACDGQTDGQTDRFATTVSRTACIGMLTRDYYKATKLQHRSKMSPVSPLTELSDTRWKYCVHQVK